MHVDDLRAAVSGLMPGLRADLEALVRLPSVAFEGFPEGPVLQAAEAVAELFRRAGLPEVRLVDIAGAPPAVYAARPAAPGAPTALLYAHYDVQPAGDEAAWTSLPFEPTERAGRLYGRGAADDKSGIVMHTGALTVLGAERPVGIKVLIEGSEEVGGTGIEDFVRDESELLAADVIVIADGGNVGLGVPTLTTSLRGMAALDVEVETLEGAVHSGMFGGPAPDALIALMRMVATLHDEAGDVTVEGLATVAYDGDEYDPQVFRADAGVLPGVDLIGCGSVAERLCCRPSITVIGLDAPPVEGARNALVPRARARVSVRLAPGQDPWKPSRRSPVTSRKSRRGTSGSPSRRAPRAKASSRRPAAPRYAAAGDALAAAFRATSRTTGKAAPSRWWPPSTRPSPEAEIVLWGANEPQCRIHGVDESVDLVELERCVLAETLFLGRAGGAGLRREARFDPRASLTYTVRPLSGRASPRTAERCPSWLKERDWKSRGRG